MSRSADTTHDPRDFEAAKRMAQSDDPLLRRRVAEHPDSRPELLYYLVADASPDVRKAVANNVATPRQADLLLARDREVGVRGSLALKIGALVPDLPASQLSQIEQMTVSCLETLAKDQATEIRRILSDALKELPNAPHAVINRLARDVELSVAGPVLKHSPILTEDDLLDIIMNGPIAGALSCIAGRRDVSASVADAIARSDDEAAISALLSNQSAQIREETLDRIIDEAPRHEPWHGPLVRRPKLPPRAVQRLASFVADGLLKLLQDRPDLDPATARQLAETVRTRLEKSGQPVGPRGPVDFDEEGLVVGADAEKPAERPTDRAARLNKEGKLTEKVVEAGLSEGDRAFVMASLAELSGIPLGTVDRIVATHAPRAVTALVWRTGLSMRFARQVQLRLAQIPPKSALNARDGAHYPMTEDEMRWQLEFFGIEAKK